MKTIRLHKQYVQELSKDNIKCNSGFNIRANIFYISKNDLFFIVSDVSLHNFSIHNTLSAFTKTILRLIDILQSGSGIVIDWFKNNKMILNPDKHNIDF